MIRISIQAHIKPLEGYAALLGNAERATQDILRLVTQRNLNTYMRMMEAIDPGPSQHGGGRGAWSTDPAADNRARRWWFANYPAGRPRTGGLMRAWVFTVRGNRLSLENTSPAGKYVLSMARQPRARGGRPNPGHIRTGWPQETRRVAQQVMAQVADDVHVAWSRSLMASAARGEFTVIVP